MTIHFSKCIAFIAWSFLVALAISSCSGDSSSARTVSIQKEILFPDLKGRVNAIARTGDGGFVVAGAFDSAWVIRTTSTGDFLWKFQDPVRQGITPEDNGRSVFKSIIPLDNGSFFLCGTTATIPSENDFLILGSDGQISSRWTEVPLNDPKYRASRLLHCLRWNQGIAVIGWVIDGEKGRLWLLALDGDGKRRWDKIISGVIPGDAIQIEGRNLMISANNAQSKTVSWAINEQGEVVATNAVSGYDHILLRATVPSAAKVLTYDGPGRASLHALDSHLLDASSPVDFPMFYAGDGCGYELSDGSVALFGRQNGAAVAWVSQSGTRHTVYNFPKQYDSFAVTDAAKISDTEFVTVRDSFRRDVNATGMVMSWITIR